MKTEYKTITSERFVGGLVPQAKQSSEDWFLVSSIPLVIDDAGGRMMYWTWGREQKHRMVECPTDGCGSVARRDGKCIACGAEIPVES